jgi:hypothetical protein
MQRQDPSNQRRLQALQTNARDLELQLTRKGQEINVLANSLAHVSLLPPEVLVEIFNAGRQMTSYYESSFPLLVPHVFGHWREVALQSPGLWTYIYIGGGSKSEAILDLYLERSLEQSLDIEMIYSIWTKPSGDEIGTLHRDLFSNLARHAIRWRHLHIKVSMQPHLTWMFNHLRDLHAPRLELFHLEIEDDAVDPESCNIFRAGTSLLSSVILCGDALQFGLPPLNSVSNLEPGPHTRHYLHRELYEALVTPQALSKLVLRHHLHVQRICPNLPLPVELPSLQSLEILPVCNGRFGFGFDFERTFNFIGAPNLKSLILDVPTDKELCSLIAALGYNRLFVKLPRLTTLVLHLWKIPDGTLRNVCDVFPTVTGIMSTPGNVRGLLNFLDSTEGPAHWPQLHSVEILISGVVQIRLGPAVYRYIISHRSGASNWPFKITFVRSV